MRSKDSGTFSSLADGKQKLREMAALYKTSTGRMFHAGEIGSFEFCRLSCGVHNGQLAIVTVGLPARGKTYLSHKLCRYLRWMGVSTCIFSVGDYRRRKVGAKQHGFFHDPDTEALRQQVNLDLLNDFISALLLFSVSRLQMKH